MSTDMIRKGVMMILGVGIIVCAIFLYRAQVLLKSQAQQAEEYSQRIVKYEASVQDYDEKSAKYDRIIKISQRKIESYLRKLDACQN